MNEEKEIAFKDFKKSVGKKEFKAVLILAKNEYKSLKKVLESTNKFKEKCSSDLLKASKEMSVETPVFLEKLVKNLTEKADKQVINLFEEQIERVDDVTNFINRFQKPGKEYEQLDFSFLNKNNK